MRAVLAKIAFLLAVLMPSPANAGNQTGTVITVVSATDGKTIVSLTGTHVNNPACSSTGRWAFDHTTASGQALLADLLTGASTGKTIQIVGTGACTSWSDSEDARYVYIFF